MRRGWSEPCGGLFSQTESRIHTPVASATLPSTQQLENILLSRNANQIPNTTSSYTVVYRSVPSQTNAPQNVRNMIDMNDAVAQDAMKRAISIDNLADLELQAASQINQSIQTAAPGSAPIIEAQADAWLVRSNAYTQAALADLMRVQAVDLANVLDRQWKPDPIIPTNRGHRIGVIRYPADPRGLHPYAPSPMRFSPCSIRSTGRSFT